MICLVNEIYHFFQFYQNAICQKLEKEMMEKVTLGDNISKYFEGISLGLSSQVNVSAIKFLEHVILTSMWCSLNYSNESIFLDFFCLQISKLGNTRLSYGNIG